MDTVTTLLPNDKDAKSATFADYISLPDFDTDGNLPSVFEDLKGLDFHSFDDWRGYLTNVDPDDCESQEGAIEELAYLLERAAFILHRALDNYGECSDLRE